MYFCGSEDVEEEEEKVEKKKKKEGKGEKKKTTVGEKGEGAKEEEPSVKRPSIQSSYG